MRPAWLLFGLSSFVLLVAAACSDSDASAPSLVAPDAGADATTTPPSSATTSDAAVTSAALTFSYRPDWPGVKSVDVLGAFGQTGDWTTPILTLTNDGTGLFTGTTPALPDGTYAYLFRVTGDSAAPAAKADAFVRYAIDPGNPAFLPCPTASPTFSAAVANPCAQASVPQPAAAATYHLRGVVQKGGAPIADYLVVVERDEDDSHHELANRATTGPDGEFDLVVAQGSWRLQVLHPTYLSMTDAERTSPTTLAAVRRSISSAIAVTADVAVNAADVAYTTYGAMTPQGGHAALPTTCSFAVDPGTRAHAEIYGPGATIGDPWWSAPVGTATTDVFDGGFNTAKADDAGIKPAATYYWGIEEIHPMPAGGAVSWTAQSMVFPVQWP